MNVYRVYEPYHYDDESGTHEYGTFSTVEYATFRVAKVWAEKKYPEVFEQYETGGRYARGAWDYCQIIVESIEVDKDINEENVGYT